MSDKNRWEPLHRLSTTYALAVAFCGGAAVSSCIKAVIDFFGRSSLPWWGDAVVAGVLAAIIAWLLRRSSRQLTADQTVSAATAISVPKIEPVTSPAQQTQKPEPSKPAGAAHITGVFCKVEIVRYGVIKETRTNGQNWMLCSFKVNLALTVRGAPSVEIKDIRLRTHRNKPPCRPLPSVASPQVTMLEEQYTGQMFEAYPQVEFHYFGGKELPESIDLVVVDEFERQHVIHLKDGEHLPVLPEQ